MKKLHLLTLAGAAVLASTLAMAQTAAPGTVRKPDANADGVISKAEAAAFPKLAERFEQLDKNKDGKLSADEQPMRRAGMRQRGGMQGRDAGRSGMQGLDADRDGRISKAELQAGQGRLDERFARMDVNKDGYIDRADHQARMQERRAECFGKADADKNGQLSRAEFDKLGEACGPRGGGMPQHRMGRTPAAHAAK